VAHGILATPQTHSIRSGLRSHFQHSGIEDNHLRGLVLIESNMMNVSKPLWRTTRVVSLQCGCLQNVQLAKYWNQDGISGTMSLRLQSTMELRTPAMVAVEQAVDASPAVRVL
jgi:hypothetical protein